MRISTQTIFDNGLAGMLTRQRDLVKTQEHISSGRRVLTPSDDPVAASQMLDVSEAKALNTQYRENATVVRNRVGIQEAALNAVVRVIQDVKTVAVQAGNGALSEGDLRSLAEEVRGRYEELIGHANSTDGNGEYLFAGFRTQTKPFAETAPGVVAYFGDEGRREVAVSPSRAIAINDPGADVFQKIVNGNGTFVTAAAVGNTGTGVVSPGAVTDASLVTGNDYSVTFAVSAAGVTTYTVTNTTTATAVATGVPYDSGAPIVFDGMQIEIEGAPRNGDTFTTRPSSNVSLFATMHELSVALQSAGSGDVANARLTNALNTVHSNMQNALDRVLNFVASVGTRLKETDTVASIGEDLNLQYETRLSELRDLDYAKAISDLTFEQAYLDAAQKSFQRVSGLSLFNYL
jgi:flagellar hook-associated protein 3 FlgL